MLPPKVAYDSPVQDSPGELAIWPVALPLASKVTAVPAVQPLGVQTVPVSATMPPSAVAMSALYPGMVHFTLPEASKAIMVDVP